MTASTAAQRQFAHTQLADDRFAGDDYAMGTAPVKRSMWNHDLVRALLADADALPAAEANAKDHYEESIRAEDKLTLIRAWYDENQQHELLKSDGECTEDCTWCRLQDILDGKDRS